MSNPVGAVEATLTLGGTGGTRGGDGAGAAPLVEHRVEVERVEPQEEPTHVYSIFYDDPQNVNGEAKVCTLPDDVQTTVHRVRSAMQRLLAQGEGAVTNFRIDLTEMRVTYEQGGNQVEVELQEQIDTNPAVKVEYDNLITALQPSFNENLRTTKYQRGCRTSRETSVHKAPLKHASDAHQGLLPGNNFSDSAKLAMKLFSNASLPTAPGQPPQQPTAEQQEAALQRIVAAEQLMKRQAANDSRTELQREWKALPDSSFEKRVLGRKMQGLADREDTRLAVYLTAAFYPSELSEKAITQAAESVKAALESHLEAQRTATNQDAQRAHETRHQRAKFSPLKVVDWIKGVPSPTQISKDEAYCADVAALMFSTLPAAEARGAYLKFCRKHELKPTAVCVADDLVQSVGKICSLPPGAAADSRAFLNPEYLMPQAHLLIEALKQVPGLAQDQNRLTQLQQECVALCLPGVPQANAAMCLTNLRAVVGQIQEPAAPAAGAPPNPVTGVKKACEKALEMLERNITELQAAHTVWQAHAAAAAGGVPSPVAQRRSEAEVNTQIDTLKTTHSFL